MLSESQTTWIFNLVGTVLCGAVRNASKGCIIRNVVLAIFGSDFWCVVAVVVVVVVVFVFVVVVFVVVVVVAPSLASRICLLRFCRRLRPSLIHQTSSGQTWRRQDEDVEK